eukprot:CAMPEP_0204220706 /NCGR_PEP_ID=MMETSP0361-20130328/81120_1 /ASSEMBLY_ACC=CAM_ASM_000343 /TAXON_ID=268821 /ORGANISM="Scrippsiella Hangoei, Strain SHTV-5" /LENGTH=52 /DNA_ID=CAMNT_0051186129 /DNA_START=95 /DNA_END=253 /DNA_ORIENTATION=+
MKQQWHGAASPVRTTANVGVDNCGCRGDSSDEQNDEREELWSEIFKQVGEGD